MPQSPPLYGPKLNVLCAAPSTIASKNTGSGINGSLRGGDASKKNTASLNISRYIFRSVFQGSPATGDFAGIKLWPRHDGTPAVLFPSRTQVTG